MPHRLEFFSSRCPLCRRFQLDVELGKCAGCTMELVDVRDPDSAALLQKYDIRVVPTLVIDSRIKVEGPIDEPWMCSDDFYETLAQKFLLTPRSA